MASERSMMPREHGAYAQLLFPIVSVLVGGAPTAATFLFGIAAIAGFLANEPLLVLAGHRGARAQRETGDRAKRALLVFVTVAIVAGAGGMLLAPRSVQLAVLLPLILGTLLVTLALQGRERSLPGQVVAAAALSSVAVPLGLSANLGSATSVAVALVWAVSALLGTAVVRLVVAGTKAKTRKARRTLGLKRILLMTFCVVVAGIAVAAPFESDASLRVLAAAVPVAVVVLAVAVFRPNARRLRTLGWSLVAANLLSLVAVVATLRVTLDFHPVEQALLVPMY